MNPRIYDRVLKRFLLRRCGGPSGFVLAFLYSVFISRRYFGKVGFPKDTQGFY